MSRRLLVVVAGPTGVGKTAVAVRLAQHFHTAVVSADSRQFFREIPIGTAQPTTAEMAGVRHYFIGSRSIKEPLDAGAYGELALQVINEEFEAKQVVILCGGSGLYIDAVVNGFDRLPQSDENVREALRRKMEEGGLPALLDELEETDPEYYREVDRMNHVRIMRALEVCRVSGMKYSELRKGKTRENSFGVLKICLELPRAELYARINERVEAMMAAGLEQEARAVYDFRDLNPLRTVGYKELFSFFDGKMTKEEAVALIKQHSRNYAKRQLTWWRRDAGYKWFSPAEMEGIIAAITAQQK